MFASLWPSLCVLISNREDTCTYSPAITQNGSTTVLCVARSFHSHVVRLWSVSSAGGGEMAVEIALW